MPLLSTIAAGDEKVATILLFIPSLVDLALLIVSDHQAVSIGIGNNPPVRIKLRQESEKALTQFEAQLEILYQFQNHEIIKKKIEVIGGIDLEEQAN